MMNIILSLIILSNLYSDECKEKYLNLLLSDYSINSFYVQVSVKDSFGSMYEMVAQNHYLYDYFKNNDNLTKENYKQFIKMKLLKKQYFVIDTSKLKAFFVVIKDLYVDSVAKYGQANFIENYFYRDGEFKKEIDKSFPAIISNLFNMNVPVRIDDESGNILVVKSFTCN